jgi:hypothetical protein
MNFERATLARSSYLIIRILVKWLPSESSVRNRAYVSCASAFEQKVNLELAKKIKKPKVRKHFFCNFRKVSHEIYFFRMESTFQALKVIRRALLVAAPLSLKDDCQAFAFFAFNLCIQVAAIPAKL